jgi:hypothetical protein
MAMRYIESTGTGDLISLEILKAPHFIDVSVNEWIARLPDNLAEAHLKMPLSTIATPHKPRTRYFQSRTDANSGVESLQSSGALHTGSWFSCLIRAVGFWACADIPFEEFL